jgi:hypothetical protein
MGHQLKVGSIAEAATFPTSPMPKARIQHERLSATATKEKRPIAKASSPSKPHALLDRRAIFAGVDRRYGIAPYTNANSGATRPMVSKQPASMSEPRRGQARTSIDAVSSISRRQAKPGGASRGLAETLFDARCHQTDAQPW